MGCQGSKPGTATTDAIKNGIPAPVVKSSFLEGAPNDEIDLTLAKHETLSLSAAVCKMQGWRRNQEDMGVAHCGLPGAPDALMLGVFDGHSGDTSSTYAAANVWSLVVKSKPWKSGAVEAALVQGFMEVDKGLRALKSKDGSTAVCALVTQETLWVANCGDSRAVLCRRGAAVPMSVDHKPDLLEEAERIRRAGGFVDKYDPRCPRVMAPNCYMAMATSRTLGDFHFKTNTNRPADEQIVSPRPTVTQQSRHPSDEFLVLASDGVWDVMTNQDVCDFLLQRTAEQLTKQQQAEFGTASVSSADNTGADAGAAAAADGSAAAATAESSPSVTSPPVSPTKKAKGKKGTAAGKEQTVVGEIAAQLLAHCLQKGTMDNCTVVIVDLRGSIAATPQPQLQQVELSSAETTAAAAATIDAQ